MPMVQIRRLEGGLPERPDEMTIASSDPAWFETPTSGTAVIADKTERHHYGSGGHPPSVGPATIEILSTWMRTTRGERRLEDALSLASCRHSDPSQGSPIGRESC